ncbi:MAG TPA: DUF1918 domain-containing protein [Streptosporangiaceae bacterium]|jgi:hypothetical protein
MRAKAGDKLLTGSGSAAIIVDVLGTDGHPPYIVRWPGPLRPRDPGRQPAVRRR